MTVATALAAEEWNQNGAKTMPVRVLTSIGGWQGRPHSASPDWVVVQQPLDKLRLGGGLPGDCLVLESGDLAAFFVDELARTGLPVVLALSASDRDAPALSAGDDDVLAVVDKADGFVFADDDAASIHTELARVTATRPDFQVADLSDGTARTISALSAEAGRIADALARLANAQGSAGIADQPIDATLVRRLLKVRRDRERFFPAEIFADPAWDMLLDLMAARMESKPVPVSSLCIAASVPTTTALRWIRSLSEAGLFERRVDPADARRTYISLSAVAADAMLAWLRMFGGQFAVR